MVVCSSDAVSANHQPDLDQEHAQKPEDGLLVYREKWMGKRLLKKDFSHSPFS